MKRLIEITDMKDALTNQLVTYEEASNFLSQINIQLFIHQMLNRFDSGDVNLDKTDLESLTGIVEIAFYIYTYSDFQTHISDPDYDKLYELIVLNGKEEFITLPSISKNKETAYHSYPQLRGTLSKIHYLNQPNKKENKSRKSLDSWIDKTENLYYKKTGKHIDLRSLDIYVFPKWDGVSAIFEFNKDGSLNRALTRGYTKFNTAEDISHHFNGLKRNLRTLDGGPTKEIAYGLKTEIMVEESTVEEYNQHYSKDYKQSRSIASGIINSDVPDERNKYLVIMQLRYIEENSDIEELCPEVFDHPFIRTKLGNYDDIENFAQEHRYADGLRCDGAVIYIIDKDVRRILGRDNDKNNFEVAYKFTEESAYSTVTDIEFQVGLLGRITPVVKFKPIKMKGNTISSASLSNIERMEELRLAKGDKVKILYDIIPYATIDVECEYERSGNNPIRPKEECPSCGEKLDRVGPFLLCTNMECDCRKKGLILNYLVKLRIMDISYAIVDALYDMGILRNIADLYKLELHEDEIVNTDGFGKVSFDNWIRQINDKRRVPDYLVLGALGISGIAEKNFELILNKYTLDELLDIIDDKDIDSLVSIKGIGEKKAKKIISGIKEVKPLIKFLRKELDIYHESLSDVKFTVCFTKVRDIELEKYIISLGGKVVNSVTKDTTYLVVPNLDTNSSKIKNANKYGTKIVVIDRLKSVLDKEYGI